MVDLLGRRVVFKVGCVDRDGLAPAADMGQVALDGLSEAEFVHELPNLVGMGRQEPR